MTKWRVILTVETEDDVRALDVRDYVASAVRRMGGSYPPDDPFFGDNKKVGPVKVTKIRPAPKRKRNPPIPY